MSFSGKTVIVTGGCGGLGEAISKAFLAEGANVVAADINAQLISSFESANGKDTLLAHQCDISSEEGVDGLFRSAIHKFGQVDILINNAGVMDSFEPVGELEKKIWDRVLGVNLTAVYLTSNKATKHMVEKQINGSILNVGSFAGTVGWGAGAAYTASKWGLIGLTKNTASFYGDKGVRCNAILPGGMKTNVGAHFAQGYRFVDVANVAGLILYLSGDGAKLVNGACVPIDNGWTAY
ncbi:dehydrogenase with different specificitie [Myriangium duriaei CBS 260.36]|uniref:Dehydrogenase with different specificitie n=1 Tax=Myriangium duriaei CBS 260.36 TaxID=1168546 RepID=A0A9P4IRQ6_9PEZI|nr:dehydrogenase with different specificitie [Myriangium duriaei CBS 260.36]